MSNKKINNYLKFLNDDVHESFFPMDSPHTGKAFDYSCTGDLCKKREQNNKKHKLLKILQDTSNT